MQRCDSRRRDSNAALIQIPFPFGGCVVMRKCPASVIPSAARDLVFSATYEEEILRLRLGMTVATQSLAAEG
jgi:hypothetical protein